MSSYGYSCNNNQNNFVEDGKTTSRVLQQPGGKCSISLGWTNSGEEEEEKQTKVTKGNNGLKDSSSSNTAASNSIDIGNDMTTSKTGTASITSSSSKGTTSTSISNNAFANGNNQNSGNVITDRPSSRVLHPPGGKSSIQLS